MVKKCVLLVVCLYLSSCGGNSVQEASAQKSMPSEASGEARATVFDNYRGLSSYTGTDSYSEVSENNTSSETSYQTETTYESDANYATETESDYTETDTESESYTETETKTETGTGTCTDSGTEPPELYENYSKTVGVGSDSGAVMAWLVEAKGSLEAIRRAVNHCPSHCLEEKAPQPKVVVRSVPLKQKVGSCPQEKKNTIFPDPKATPEGYSEKFCGESSTAQKAQSEALGKAAGWSKYILGGSGYGADANEFCGDSCSFEGFPNFEVQAPYTKQVKGLFGKVSTVYVVCVVASLQIKCTDKYDTWEWILGLYAPRYDWICKEKI